ncbi:MAG TPA: DUF2254 domain-containing protein [Candidatus Limnocylindrales bacterium]|nr:DUF2254 domain-containing protein [Candidatus Limnocylindrales bacterium]
MSTKYRHYWTLLRSTFWFVPGLMVVAAALLAGITLAADTALRGIDLPGWMYAGGADGARALLSTVAGSMVTVAGLGFSITIVALVLASTQFGPRLLTLFMRDVTSQATLGVFAGTFTFCVLVLRSIRGPGEGGAEFVPQVSITVALGLTLLSVGMLVYFFHHVAESIQAPKLVATVARDLDRAIDRLYPQDVGYGGPEPAPADVPDPSADPVIHAAANGYVQVVDDAALLAVATGHDLCVRLLIRPGLFVVRGNAIIAVRSPAPITPALEARLRSTLIVGNARTAEDDLEFSVRQLVEIALRALSPAINDPFTAMAAIDWLGAALARLAAKEWPSRFRYDEAGRLRVVADVSTFGGVTHTIFSRIRHYGGASPVVLNRLLEAVAAFGPHIQVAADRDLVRDETEAVMTMGRSLITSQADLAELDRRYRRAIEALGGAAGEARPVAG